MASVKIDFRNLATTDAICYGVAELLRELQGLYFGQIGASFTLTFRDLLLT